MNTNASIKSIFKGVKRYTTAELRNEKRKHATQLAYFKHISSGRINTALNKTGLLHLTLKFLNQYNFLKGNFCLGRDRIAKEWHVSHQTIKKFFLLLHYLEVIEPYGIWVIDRPRGSIKTPMWILTDKLFTLDPKNIYYWAEKLHFGMCRPIYKTTQGG